MAKTLLLLSSCGYNEKNEEICLSPSPIPAILPLEVKGFVASFVYILVFFLFGEILQYFHAFDLIRNFD